jgi:hypothetical protein
MNTINQPTTQVEINTMKAAILENMHQPSILEKSYRENKAMFTQAFNNIYPEIQENPTAQTWNARLNYPQEEINWGKSSELIFVIIAAFISGLIAKIPAFTGIKMDFFFERNISFVVFPLLIAFFSWKQKLATNRLLFPFVAILLLVFYINFLPNKGSSDSIMLACIHLPFFLWAITGYSFVGGKLHDVDKKINFLRYNGELVVMSAIIMLSGFVFSAMTIGLFSLLGISIETFYANYVAIWGISAIPIVATYLVQNNPQLVNKISPIIAKLFTPLVFLTLLIFLFTLLYTGKNLYNDRDFLLLFNALLIGVLAIIIFSVTEATKNNRSNFTLFILFGLSTLTIISNGIALSAIAFRLFEFGITANRMAVLGGNLLIFSHLIFVAHALLLVIRRKAALQKVDYAIALFIPIYGIWAAIVTLIMPLLFNFK